MTTVFLLFLLIVLAVAVTVACIVQCLSFIVGISLKRNDIADVMWGFTFVTIASVFFLIPTIVHLQFRIIYLLILVWGLRLTYHLGKRFFERTQEDRRYVGWRTDWKYFKTRSFFQIYILQGLLAVLVLMSFLSYVAAPGINTTWLFIIGFVIWCIGFIFEIVGDFQLEQFIKSPERYGLNKGDMMTKGVWAWTRHPNYFGEMSMWWGIWLMCLYTLTPVYVVTTLIGPLTITVLLLFVSGVPMTERHWKEKYKTQYVEYKSRVPVLIPWKIVTNFFNKK